MGWTYPDRFIIIYLSTSSREQTLLVKNRCVPHVCTTSVSVYKSMTQIRSGASLMMLLTVGSAEDTCERLRSLPAHTGDCNKMVFKQSQI